MKKTNTTTLPGLEPHTEDIWHTTVSHAESVLRGLKKLESFFVQVQDWKREERHVRIRPIPGVFVKKFGPCPTFADGMRVHSDDEDKAEKFFLAARERRARKIRAWLKTELGEFVESLRAVGVKAEFAGDSGNWELRLTPAEETTCPRKDKSV